MKSNSAIAVVRKSQRSISRDFLLNDLRRFPPRNAFIDAAQHVVEHYFPRAVERGNTGNVSDLVDMYVHAFVLAPLTYRIPGAYRPDWSTGTVLSWFRRCISNDTKQWYWCKPAVEINRSPSSVTNAFTQHLHINDPLFVSAATQVLCNLSASGGRKSSAARLHLDPFAAMHFDMQMNEYFHVRASGPIRRKLRANKELVGSYLRMGETAFLLADQATAHGSTPNGYTWTDIRDVPIKWNEYVIEWARKEEHLRIRINTQIIAASLREIKSAIGTAKTPHWKHKVASAIASRFLHQHRYATGSLVALREYNQSVHKMIRKHVTSTIPSLVHQEGHVKVYDKLVLPIVNPFLETDTSVISNNTWLSFWNPYR